MEALVGQLFVSVMHPERHLREALKDHRSNHYGGIFLKRQNLRDVDRARRLTFGFRRHTQDIPPMLVAVDEEGGLVTSMSRLTTPAPSPAALGYIDDEEVTKDVHFGVGEKLRALGINTVFGPVLDVHSEPSNPVIGTRSFGRDPALVTRHGTAALAGLTEAGVAVCVKHFPGHGATTTDSHKTLPTVDADRHLLGERELLPFIAAFGQDPQPDMVMSAHVVYKGLDKSTPATLSRTVLTDLLRRELGFLGLIVTDSMDMAAITELMDPGKAAVAALEAGADVLLYGLDAGIAGAGYAGVLAAVKSGKIKPERIADSVDRMFKLRDRFRGASWMDDDRANEILRFDHDGTFYQAALDGTLLEGNAGVLKDIGANQGKKLIVLPREIEGSARLPLNVVREQLRPEGFKIVDVAPRPTDEEIATARGFAEQAEVVVVGTASRGPMVPENRKLIKAVTERDVLKVGVALLDPADADAMQGTNCRIKTFGISPPHLWAMSQKLSA